MMAENISFRISAVDDFSRTMRSFERNMDNALSSVRNGTNSVSEATRGMANEMRQAYRDMRDSMSAFRVEQMAVEYQFFQLGQNAEAFAGRTGDFMAEIERLGRAQRTINDNMLRNNRIALGQFYQQVGALTTMTTQAARISANYDRMANPMYRVNQAGLGIANSLNRMANRGNAAVVALSLLGPTANMQQLQNMTAMITQGLMRFQMVAIGAAIASALLYSALHKGAMETVAGYEESFNRMKSLVRQAFQPMVDVFGMVMMKVYQFTSAIAEMVIRFNEAHPVLAKIIQGIMMLIPALTLLLSPLAIGIGLVAGFKAAFGFLWTMIGPVVTGLAAMSATVWLVAAAIVGLVAGFTIAYNKIEWFRNAVDTAWAWIKATFMSALNVIKAAVAQAMAAVSKYFGEELAKIRKFWDENGTEIMRVVKVVMAFIAAHITANMAIIKAVITVAWNIIVGIVKGVWEVLKGVISGGVQMILGIIKTFISILHGDWRGAWEGLKDIAQGAIKALGAAATSMFTIGKNIVMGLINGIKSAAGGLMETARNIANSVTKTIKGALNIHSPSRVMMELGSYTTEGFALGLSNQLAQIRAASRDMATTTISNIAGVQPVKNTSTSAQPSQINLTLNYNGPGSEEDAYNMLNLVERGLNERLGLKLRMNGVR
jgi:phage-related protein